MSDRIDFMIIGAQKAGTTALFEHLGEEQGVALSAVKEVHFFDDDAIDWENPDYSRYHSQFPPADGNLRGEATPIYSYWPNALERIGAYNPQVRLILILRDPVERAWSHWKMEFSRGAETQPFSWCVRQGRQRLFVAEPWGHHREFSYVERGFYGEQVERLFQLFPREQVLMLTADALRRKPAATIASVRSFLGLEVGPAAQPRESHVGRDMDYGAPLSEADRAWLRSIYARDDARLQALTGISFASPPPISQSAPVTLG